MVAVFGIPTQNGKAPASVGRQAAQMEKPRDTPRFSALLSPRAGPTSGKPASHLPLLPLSPAFCGSSSGPGYRWEDYR